jgi:hypothetical protein
VVTLALKKKPWFGIFRESGIKVPLLPLGRSCPLKTILQSDLVGCDSPLQIAMAIWHPFLKFETDIILSRGLSHPTQEVQIKKKCAILPLLSAEDCHIQLDGQHCRLRTYPGIFSRVEKPSEDINNRLFLMNKKGLRIL